MIYAPVMITTCNRYEHLKRCIESLQKNTYADRTEIYISVDYPPNEKYIEGWEKVCKMLNGPLKVFSKTHIFFQKVNLGAENNYSYLEKLIFKKYDRLIFTEDDNEFSTNFLIYMNKGLELYENHPRIYGVCGYADDCKFRSGEDNVIPLTNFCAWGMGIWKKKEKIIQEQLTIQNWIGAAQNIRLMMSIYRARPRLFSRMVGEIISSPDQRKLLNTDINRGIFLAINGFCTINPVKSKVRNWGWDGSGQNITGNLEGYRKHSSLQLDMDKDFEYRLSQVEQSFFNDSLLDDNCEWNSKRAKWYNDPLLYFMYRILGRERFLKFTHRK